MSNAARKEEVLPAVATPAAGTALTPMEMLDRAVANGASPEALEKLMALQERWEQNQARRSFDEAIAEAKSEIPPIIRNAKGHNAKLYADFAQIARTIDPILVKHGLSYRFRSEQGDRINVTCILSHRAGHREETTLTGPADTTGNKNPVQAIGSTLQYLERYSLMMALGLAAAHDDDGIKAGDVLSDEQAANIRELLEAKGVSKERFLKWAKVEKIEDIQAQFYDSCVDNIKRAGK